MPVIDARSDRIPGALTRRPGRIHAFCLLLLFPLPHAPGQESVATLRARLARGDAVAVLAEIRNRAASGHASLEEILVGCEAGILAEAYDHAGSLADAATQLAPKDPRPHLWNGHALFRMAEIQAARAQAGGSGGFIRATFADAARFYRDARRLGGDAYTLAYFEAEALLLAEEPGPALDAASAALAAKPGDPAATALKGRILLAAGRAAEAAAMLGEARTAGPDDRQLAETHLRAVLESGDRTLAREVFLGAVKAFPQERALYDAFVGRFQAERPDTFVREALVAASAATPIERDRFPWWYLGGLEEAQQRWPEALQAYTRYRDALPTTPEGAYKVGRALTVLGRLEEARDALLRAQALGGLPDEELALGFAYLVGAYLARRDQESAAHLQRIVATLQPTVDEELNLGVIEFGAGRRDEGLRIYRRILARDDLDRSAAARTENYLGLGLLGVGQAAEAEASFRRALLADEENLDAAENLGILLLRAGKREEGLRLLDRVVAAPDRDPPRPKDRARYHLLRARHPGILGHSSP